MQPKDYQQQALGRFNLYLDELDKFRANYDKLATLKAQDPTLDLDLPDFPAKTWRRMLELGEAGRAKEYSPRRDGTGRPVPNVTLKVPTGGGKTYLAAACSATLAIRWVGREEPRFVLWIMPNEAIYTQTKKTLTDRSHPYRTVLDIAAQGRVKIMEKDSPLHADDLKASLCVMLLMLPSANRETKEQLRLFRDRGNVHGFLPADDDQPAHEALRGQVPNLDYVDALGLTGEERPDIVGLVKASLGNVLRLVRPIVVVDEGQKAFSDLAYRTLYDFNPRFVIELSATPRDGTARWANWLCNISGEELLREEMIKMPMEVHVQGETDWRDCLREAWRKTEDLRLEAERHRADSQTYIRPILLVQVERVGKDQHDSGYIHSAEAREYLMSLGLPDEAIAIKTAEQNDLKHPEKQDLLQPGNPVRAIITKQALQEGWDCPFAYVLCALAVSRSASALTQLVGRVLRQPYAAKTGREALDRCYVYTHRAQTRAVLDAIKAGLEKDGMSDLAGRVIAPSSTAAETVERRRREGLQAKSFYLPRVKVSASPDRMRDLDWETDILSQVDWLAMPFEEDGEKTPKGEMTGQSQTLVVGLEVLRGPYSGGGSAMAIDQETFDRQFAVRALSGSVPNPWVASVVVDRFLKGLESAGWTEKERAERQVYLLGELTRAVQRRLDEAAKQIFDRGLRERRIRFHLTTAKWDWQIPLAETIDKSKATASKLRNDGQPFQRSLFEPVYDGELNSLEFHVACFLDRQEAVWWWYRNVVRGYGLQGWRKNRMYPDFVIAKQRIGELVHWLVVETKGDQLAGNLDTAYKSELMQCLTDAYTGQTAAQLGELVIKEAAAEYRCVLVAQDGWQAALNKELA